MENENIVFISLSKSVKEKIKSKFENDVEDFIEKEFPQDKNLDCHFFKYKGTKDGRIGLKYNTPTKTNNQKSSLIQNRLK